MTDLTDLEVRAYNLFRRRDGEIFYLTPSEFEMSLNKFRFLGLKKVWFITSLLKKIFLFLFVVTVPRVCKHCRGIKIKSVYKFRFQRISPDGYLSLDHPRTQLWFTYCKNCNTVEIVGRCGDADFGGWFESYAEM